MMFYVIMLFSALWAMGRQSKLCVHLRSQEKTHNANMELFHLTNPIRTATGFTLSMPGRITPPALIFTCYLSFHKTFSKHLIALKADFPYNTIKMPLLIIYSDFMLCVLFVTVSSILCYMSRNMRFPTMWYVGPAKPQTSLHISAVWSESLLGASIIYEC